MPLFEVSSRTTQVQSLPKRRTTRERLRWYARLRHIGGMLIAIALTILATKTKLAVWGFVLLPVLSSIVVTYTQRYRFDGFFSNTLRYDLFTIIWAFIYYSGIAVLEIVLHRPDLDRIILVCTALTWTVLFEPFRVRGQAFIERRFNLRNREAVEAVEAFTSTLREEVDLDKVRDGLLAVVQKTLHPLAVSLWVRKATARDKGSQPTQDAQEDVPPEKHKQELLPSAVPELYTTSPVEVPIAESDPFIAYTLAHSNAIDVERLKLDSSAIQILQANKIEIVLPLINQGELIGMLTLGPGLNGQEYTPEDLMLLNTLATQVAPALRVAQVVQEQHAQVRERERIEQELRTAQFIQLSLLPKEVPLLTDWQIALYYQPARQVGGDFYDFLPFTDGRLGIIIGDVTDKGVPAALIMATTHTMLRTVARAEVSPGEVLARVNDLLVAEIPAKMFVTCFYGILDPATGRMRYANAGQELPYRQQKAGISELWATGMPLGMLPGSSYEEQEVILAPSERLLFYSDGLVEAHNPARAMFDYKMLRTKIATHADRPALIEYLLNDLADFTGEGWEQEDDVTMITLSRLPQVPPQEHDWQLIQEWTLPSEPGNERQAMEQVSEAVEPLHLPTNQLERLKSAVAEATMNAMEHGNQYQADKVVAFQVLVSPSALSVRVRDQGEKQLVSEPARPDLTAKLAEQETPRGWGLFLIENLVDEVRTTNEEHTHTLELIMHREEQNGKIV